jgi:hypothetical protein
VAPPAGLKSVAGNFLKSFVPGLSEPCTDIKDILTGAVIFSAGGVLCNTLGTISVLCTFLPNCLVYQDQVVLRDMKKGYWPLMYWGPDAIEPEIPDDQKPSMLDNIKGKVIKALDDQTAPIKRYVVECDDCPQAICFVIYILAGNGSLFLVISNTVSIIKVLLVVFLRSYILCWKAEMDFKNGRSAEFTWKGKTGSDIGAALMCSGCSLERRVWAAGGQLYMDNDDAILIAICKSIAKLAEKDALDEQSKKDFSTVLLDLISKEGLIADAAFQAIDKLG